ncbi:MAG: flagellar basal body L-ring protein FlgH [Planctomycetota bacterium]|nr:flagellar basal body L-ring protein FlgH [Planctomycetota bacterium]
MIRLNTSNVLTALACTVVVFAPARGEKSAATEEAAPTSSLMAQSADRAASAAVVDGEYHALQAQSLFAIAPPEPREFSPHDLVQIIVQESSKAESTHETEAKKDYQLDGKVSAWPDLNLQELLNLRLFAGRATGLPEVGVDFAKDFKGDAEYKREDEFTTRLTAEVIEVLPNGNLILESRTYIQTDEEEAAIKVTGICRPEDVSAANTVYSHQMHDLKIRKMHKGELKRTNEKGIIAKILDTLFAF